MSRWLEDEQCSAICCTCGIFSGRATLAWVSATCNLKYTQVPMKMLMAFPGVASRQLTWRSPAIKQPLTVPRPIGDLHIHHAPVPPESEVGSMASKLPSEDLKGQKVLPRVQPTWKPRGMGLGITSPRHRKGLKPFSAPFLPVAMQDAPSQPGLIADNPRLGCCSPPGTWGQCPCSHPVHGHCHFTLSLSHPCL